MNDRNKNIRINQEIEECEWCNSTGDVEKNRKIYWATVAIVGFVVVILYILSRLFLS